MKKPQLRKIVLPFIFFLFVFSRGLAQNCTVNAGSDQTICVTQPLNLTGSAGEPKSNPAEFLWQKISGPAAVITTPASLTTSVTGFEPGNYVFELSSKCSDGKYATNLVSVTVLPSPPTAQAGDDYTACTNTPVSLSANAVPAPFTGKWSVSPNAGTFSDVNNPSATYTPPAGSAIYTLTWTISNGTCTSTDTKFVTISGPTLPVSAGPDRTLSCNGTCVTLAASNPGLAPQTGMWTVVSGPNTPVFSNVNSPTSTACNLIPGTYKLKWSVSGPCVTGDDEMDIIVSNTYSAPSAGSGQSYTMFCGSTATTAQVLSGNALAAGETAVWAQTNGGSGPFPNVTFTPGTTASSVTVTGLTGPFPYTFTYTKTNAAGCTNSAQHIVYRAPEITSLSEPPDVELACDVTSSSFPISYTDNPSIANTLSRTATRISGPVAASISYGTTTTSAGIKTDTWNVSGMTSPGTYIFRLEYRTSCGTQYRDIAFTTSKTLSTPNAGSSPIIPCNQLFANPIGSATAPVNLTWIQVSGPNTATLSGVNSTSLNMTGLIEGVYRMRLINSGGAACPAKTSDVLVKVTSSPPTAATTGSNATICAGRYRLSGNIPGPLETGVWTVSPSAGITFSPNANAPNAMVSGLAKNTAYTFTWTITNQCASSNSSQMLTTTNVDAPPFADAGLDKCLAPGSTSTSLNGNNPSGATIVWTALTAGSSVSPANTQSTTASFTGGSGVYLFEYALSSPGCTTFMDTVAVTINNTLSTPIAVSPQSLCVTSLPASTTLSATPVAPAGSTSIWSQLSGPAPASIASPGAASTTVSNLASGIYEFEYRIKTGSCADVFKTVTVRVAQEPSDANAGPDQSICNATSLTTVTLAATAPTVGTGYWTLVSGPPNGNTPSMSNALAPNTTVSNLSHGVYTFRWTTMNGAIVCAAKTDDMMISVSGSANAGSDVSICDKPSVSLTGNSNTTGTWDFVSGPAGTTLTSNSPNTAVVDGLVASPGGTQYVFSYTLPAAGTCPGTTDNITVTNFSAPTAADAGPDQEICFNTSSVTLTGNIPVIGKGNWTKISGPGSPTAGAANANFQDTTINNIAAGIHVYQYNVNNNASCIASTDIIQVIREVTATISPASQRFCNTTSVNLNGNAPLLNTGTWTFVSGPAGSVIENPNNPKTIVSGLVPGTYQFKWTIAGPGGCAENSAIATIIIDPPVPAMNAGSDDTFCEGTRLPFQLGSPSIPDVTYTWTPATLLSNAAIAQPTFNGVNNAGTYIYTVKGAIGTCESFDDVEIIVNPKPGANIQITPDCKPSFAATDVGNGVKLPITYDWVFGTASDATPATASGPGAFQIKYSTPGSKNISLNIVSGDGCSSSSAKSLDVISCSTLPVQLHDFTADWKNMIVLLKWDISGATGFDRFEIERSFDGVTFSKLNTAKYIAGKNQYQYEDKNINPGVTRIYYRLKLVDADGAYTYSATRVVTNTDQKRIIVSPNPFSEKLGIHLTKTTTSGRLTIKLISSSGAVVAIINKTVQVGENYIELNNLNHLNSGIYLLQLDSGDKLQTVKVVKQ